MIFEDLGKKWKMGKFQTVTPTFIYFPQKIIYFPNSAN